MKARRWHHCNVLEVAPDGRQLWQFAAGKDKVARGAHEKLPVDKAPAKRFVAKDWRHLVQPRLNIAWLPSRQVFLRAIQLPAGDPAELPGMVEFQLDKISPLPVTHIVWTVEALPQAGGSQQTAIVALAERSAVEEFLGRLEKEGYIADRLEVPFIRELRATAATAQTADGLWLFLQREVDCTLCLAAWWMQGVLEELSLTRLPPAAAGAALLVRQLTQTAWAGEMAGWLHGIPGVHFVGDDETAALFEPGLREWSGQPVRVQPRLEPAAVAELTAREALKPATPATLIPPEVTTRYRNQFIDRIWMRGLGAVGLAYLTVVFIYLVALNVRKWQLERVQDEAGRLALSYTNAIQLKAQVQVLQDQVNLRYAALDSWRAAIEALPPQLTLTSLGFQKGRTLTLDGTVSTEATDQVTAFNSALKKATANGQPLFANVKPAQITSRPGAPSATWRFEAELKRVETQ